MFGHSYFGARYFGPRYFGPAVAEVEPEPEPEVEQPATGGPVSGGAPGEIKIRRRRWTNRQPWESQADALPRGHRDTTRKVVDDKPPPDPVQEGQQSKPLDPAQVAKLLAAFDTPLPVPVPDAAPIMLPPMRPMQVEFEDDEEEEIELILRMLA